MRRLDELHLKYPFYGSRKLAQTLKAEGQCVNRKRVQRLMRVMGLESTAPKPNTSKPSPEHARYPYLLRNLRVSRVNQAWATDITYIPMAHGFIYLVAIIDWCSRRVLAWRLSEHDGDELLRGGPGGSHRALRLPGNLQHGSRLSVYVGRVRRCPAVARNTRSAWTAKVAGSTTSLSSVSGARSNTRRSTCTRTTRWRPLVRALLAILLSLTTSVRTQR